MDKTETWIAVAGAFVSTIGTIAAGFFLYLGSRDRNRLGTVEEKVAECEKHRDQCEESLEIAKAELVARDVADRKALEAKIAALERQVNGDK